MSLEMFFAWRYLKARRKGVFTFLTTLIAIGGITLGVAALIITLAVMTGFHCDIREKILGVQPHLIVLRDDQLPLSEYVEIDARITANSQVAAVAPFVYGQIILMNNHATSGALVKGVDLKAEERLVPLKRLLVGRQAALIERLGDHDIILGQELARSIGVKSGQDVILMTPSRIALVPRMEKFNVAGVFHSGMYEYDSSLSYIALSSAQKLFGTGNAVSGIGISLKQPERAGLVEKELQEQLSYPYLVRSWERMNHNLFAALKLEKIMMFIILALIILVAAFNIISNLLLLTVEKAKEIGILSSLGIGRNRIARIFFFEGMIIGVAGILSGVGLGAGVSLMLGKYQFIHLPADVYYLETLPVRVVAADVFSVIGATLAITIAAAIYPAYQVTKLDPLEAIRYG